MKLIVKTLSLLIIFLIIGCTRDSNNYSLDDRILRSKQYSREGKLDEAINELQKAISLDPSSVTAHYELGLSYSRKWAKTLEYAQKKHIKDIVSNPKDFLRTAEEFRKRSDSELDKLYESYGEKREFKKLAIIEFNKTLKLDPNHLDARYFIATDYLNNGLYEEAIREYTYILNKNPKHVNSLSLIAKAYYGIGNYPAAIENYKKAIDIKPSSDFDHYNLARAYLALKQRNNALKELEKLKKLDSVWHRGLEIEINNTNFEGKKGVYN